MTGTKSFNLSQRKRFHCENSLQLIAIARVRDPLNRSNETGAKLNLRHPSILWRCEPSQYLFRISFFAYKVSKGSFLHFLSKAAPCFIIGGPKEATLKCAQRKTADSCSPEAHASPCKPFRDSSGCRS